jgi:hypothetical protein
MRFILTGFLTLIVAELTIYLRKLDDPEYMEQIRARVPGRLGIKQYWRRLLLSSLKPMAILLAPKNTIKFCIPMLERLALNLATNNS